VLLGLPGPLNQLGVNLFGEHGFEWEHQFKRFLRKESNWGPYHQFSPFAGAIIPANNEPFYVRQEFAKMLAKSTDRFNNCLHLKKLGGFLFVIKNQYHLFDELDLMNFLRKLLPLFRSP